MVGASVEISPMIGATSCCRGPWKIRYAEAKTVGTMPPPMNPWIARHTIMPLIEEVVPHMMLASVKPAAETANSTRVPSARERNPDNGIAMTSAIRYEVCTHGISSADADRPAWISCSEDDTIWMSRSAMNMPKHMARNASSRRDETLAAGAKAWVEAGRAADDMGLLPRGYCHAGVACAATVVAVAVRGLVSTLTTTDMPGRSRRCVVTSAGTSMRTGSRCTILVKLPVALSGGSSENTAPEAGDRLATLPSMTCSGRASTLIDTVWPGRRRASCVSLKLASI